MLLEGRRRSFPASDNYLDDVFTVKNLLGLKKTQLKIYFN